MPPNQRPWKTVRGVVRARHAGGPPIAGALLVVVPTERELPDAHGDADNRGRFEVPCSAGRSIIYARSPAGDLAGYTAVDDKDDREVAIVAGPAATARGRVVDENGKPWASATVAYHVEIGPPRRRYGRSTRPPRWC